MAFEWSSSWIIEQAKEELQILERQHPNRFSYLKLELSTFISAQIDQQNILSYRNSISSSSSVSTQASSSKNKRKGCSDDVEKSRVKFARLNGSKERVDAAIERAQTCLQKIRQVKQSFSNNGNAF